MLASPSASIAALFAALVVPSLAAYVRTEDIRGANFFDSFNFFSAGDPTNGFVQYVDRATAQNNGLISTANGQAYIGVDTKNNVTSGPGRQSVRISTKNVYNPGNGTLILADIQHMPGAECGTWPAMWLLGPDWPNTGEIDIIEGINDSVDDTYVIHTNSGCKANQTGSGQHDSNTDCSYGGCGGHVNWKYSYGKDFNAVNGGVWALEMTPDHFSMWYWPRWFVPGDIWDAKPDPSKWWAPFVTYTGCDFKTHFKDLSFVLNTDFCGGWAGTFLFTSEVCWKKANGNCNDYVAKNPGEFKESYWSVNYISVYQNK